MSSVGAAGFPSVASRISFRCLLPPIEAIEQDVFSIITVVSIPNTPRSIHFKQVCPKTSACDFIPTYGPGSDIVIFDFSNISQYVVIDCQLAVIVHACLLTLSVCWMTDQVPEFKRYFGVACLTLSAAFQLLVASRLTWSHYRRETSMSLPHRARQMAGADLTYH